MAAKFSPQVTKQNMEGVDQSKTESGECIFIAYIHYSTVLPLIKVTLLIQQHPVFFYLYIM